MWADCHREEMSGGRDKWGFHRNSVAARPSGSKLHPMLPSAASQPHVRVVVFLIASVAVLTAYCQLWDGGGEGVPIAVSVEWAVINTAAYLAFAGGL